MRSYWRAKRLIAALRVQGDLTEKEAASLSRSVSGFGSEVASRIIDNMLPLKRCPQ